MTHERIEQGLRAELPEDEARYVARPLPASVAEARASPGKPKDGVPNGHHGGDGRARGGRHRRCGRRLDSRAGSPSDGKGIGTGDLPSATPARRLRRPASPVRGMEFAVASDPWDSAAGSRGTVIVFRLVDSTASCTLPTELTAGSPMPAVLSSSPAPLRRCRRSLRLWRAPSSSLACPGAIGAGPRRSSRSRWRSVSPGMTPGSR